MPDEIKAPSRITIHNKISPSYKTFHVDGAYGGATPRGLISIAFFSERFPLPKSSDFLITEGRIGEKISDSLDSKIGIIREYESAVMMDVHVAKELIKLLTIQIAELEKLTK